MEQFGFWIVVAFHKNNDGAWFEEWELRKGGRRPRIPWTKKKYPQRCEGKLSESIRMVLGTFRLLRILAKFFIGYNLPALLSDPVTRQEPKYVTRIMRDQQTSAQLFSQIRNSTRQISFHKENQCVPRRLIAKQQFNDITIKYRPLFYMLCIKLYQYIPCEICGGQNGTRTNFIANISAFPSTAFSSLPPTHILFVRH